MTYNRAPFTIPSLSTVMFSCNSYNTIVSGGANVNLPIDCPPAGALITMSAACLILGMSHSLSGLETWSFDSFIVPGSKATLGVGDKIVVYRHINTILTSPLPLPLFAATLSKVVSCGSNHVEFCLRDLNTGSLHPKTIKLPLCITRLSRPQRIKRALLLYPRSSSPPPRTPLKVLVRAKTPRLSRHKGDRVLRDSDDLPIRSSVFSAADTSNPSPAFPSSLT
ncbi:uncharacterized protein EDB91DRAFT_1256797 [Suillus paluster]|uniref:uncharacterized protein n=1 Tax=Suillus paluster TaxID=48578 RepID=UPI001B884107|nr:uncharacterized protein EDB91DRAFT_1256797 [Suillus paluster]KAG1720857.1 hypothetical protein EDB91DRAFT_1256797 [Suillus paluster]